MKIKNANRIPRETPYLRNHWDRLDEYYTLDSSLKEEDFAKWWAVVFKRGKIKTLEDALNLPKYLFNNITRTNSDDNWTTDLYGGYFNCFGYYLSCDFYMEWFPRDILKGKDTLQKRFNYIISLIEKYYETKN